MSRRVKIAFWIVAAAQVLFLAGFIGVKEFALRSGTEVVLQALPVDPRSPLQGDYAVLDYEIARLPPFMRDLAVGETVYVALAKRKDLPAGARRVYVYVPESEGPEAWQAALYAHERPASSAVVIKGRVDRPRHLDFGIGTFFVPEGTGHIIERTQDIRVVAVVDNDGNAAIVDLLVDGRPFDPAAE